MENNDTGHISWARSFARRQFRSIRNYDEVRDNRTDFDFFGSPTLHDGESLVGILRNILDDTVGNIAITDQGVFIMRNESNVYIRYVDIEGVALVFSADVPLNERKTKLRDVTIYAKSGIRVDILTRHFEHAAAIHKFLLRTATTLQGEQLGKPEGNLDRTNWSLLRE